MRALTIGILIALASCSPAEAGPLASERSETRAAAQLTLSSPGFEAGQAIPLRYSAYGDGVSPRLAWGQPPPGTASFALMVEDPDATSHKPYVHWMAWNIPAEARSLPEGAGAAAAMVQGRNHRGSNQWFGPRPRGKSAHRYYFQLFALDTRLTLPETASREDLLRAMNSHVLASGTLLGTFRAPS